MRQLFIKFLTVLLLLAPSLNRGIASSARVNELPCPVREVVIFTVKDGLKKAVVLKLANATTELIKHYPGFISRQLSHSISKNELWLDTVCWKNIKDANAAAQNSVHNKSMINYVNVMQNFTMYHFAPVSNPA